MNKFFLASLVLSSTFIHAAPFNGYIVKYKGHQSLRANTTIAKFGNVEKVAETSFGTFAKLNPNQGFTALNLEALKNNPDIEYVEPNYIISIKNTVSPSDPNFKKQWGLFNDGKNGGLFGGGVAGEDINATKAWGITKGSTSVKIAVIDTGVDYTHPDLVDQIDVNILEKNGKAGVDDDQNGYVDDIYGYDFANKDGDPMDGNSHGTHCAGVIGASHNGKGVAGVMAEVKIVPVKFLSDRGAGESIDAVLAIEYAMKRGVKVMSNSWGGDESENIKALEDAIKAANDKGIVFVAAAGNDSSDNDRTGSYPTNYDVPNVIAVGSHAASGSRSGFSNYGKSKVHVFAPGSNILSTTPRGRFESMSGTSMACPHVAGVVGLLLSKEPNLTPEEVRERLIKTSVKSSKLEDLSHSDGRVDAYRALMNQIN